MTVRPCFVLAACAATAISACAGGPCPTRRTEPWAARPTTAADDGTFREGNRLSYCDPSAAIAKYQHFVGPTRPEVIAPLYPSGGGRDYPVIDVHTHLASTSLEEADIQNRAGIFAAVDASWDTVSVARRRATYPRPYVIQFSLGDYLANFSADRIPAILAHFDEQRAAGAGGIKLFKQFGLEIKDSSGALLRIDDQRLAPLWQRAAEERWTVSIHTADPNSWLTTQDPKTQYTKQDLVDQFINVVAANPKTVFVAIHLLNLVDSDAELDQLGRYLDAYPNLYTDVAARSQYLVHLDQQHVRDFMIAHQDKVLFATDRYKEAHPVTRYGEEFKYWETSQPTTTYYENVQAHGLALPPAVLEKLYYKNALRAFCSELHG